LSALPSLGTIPAGHWGPIVRIVSEKWPRLGHPGDGKPVWK
jgi:hypothetical protein